MTRLLATTVTSILLLLALNGCHYYIKMMPDITVSSEPFSPPPSALPPAQPDTIFMRPEPIHVP